MTTDPMTTDPMTTDPITTDPRRPPQGRRWLTGLIEQRLLPPDEVATLCVGSTARGWATAASDLDVYVVSETASAHRGARVPVPLVPDHVRTVESELEGRRCEVTYWTAAQVDQMLAKVGRDRLDRPDTSLKPLTDAEELFLERLGSGIVLTGAQQVAAWRAAFTAGAYRTFLAARAVAESEGKVETSRALLSAGDVESAVLVARLAHAHAVDAVLDHHGVHGTRTPKWQARRVRDAGLEVLTFEDYWTVQSMRDLVPGQEPRWVGTVLARCEGLTLAVDLGREP